MEVCPLQKTGKELVVAIVNATNGSEITVDQLVFGEAGAGGEEGNTQLNLAAAPDAPWNSFVDVEYTRLDLARVFVGQQVFLSIPENATKEDLFCHLNFSYGLSFAADEFDISPAVEVTTRPSKFTITAKATNLAYTGSVEVFTDNERVHLEERLTETLLKGFVYPNANDPTLNNVIYHSDEKELVAYTQLGSYGEAPAAVRPEWRTGMKSGNNGELMIYLAADVATGYGTGSGPRQNYSKFNHPLDVDGDTRVLYQPRLTGDIAQGAFFINAGFMSPVTGQALNAADLLALYDVEFETFSRNGTLNGGVGTTLTFTVGIHPTNADVLQLQHATLPPINMTMVNNAQLGRWQRANFQPGVAALPNIKGWSASSWSRAHGEGYVKVTATRKTGKAKPIVIKYAFKTDPIV